MASEHLRLTVPGCDSRSALLPSAFLRCKRIEFSGNSLHDDACTNLAPTVAMLAECAGTFFNAGIGFCFPKQHTQLRPRHQQHGTIRS